MKNGEIWLLQQWANWAFDSEKLKAKVELLQRNHRHYLGQDLESLSMKELQSLEHHLDTALKHIRSRKNQLMHESISELQKKEKSMHDQNNLLAKKLKEREETIIAEEVQWQQQTDQHVPLDLSSGFLLSPPLPSLNIGYVITCLALLDCIYEQ
ncbi:Agamous-like MADS-box protein ap1 [Dionaea muscipula]